MWRNYITIFLSFLVALLDFFSSSSWDFYNYQRDYLLSATSEQFITLRFESLYNFIFYYSSKILSFKQYRTIEIFLINFLYLKSVFNISDFFRKNLKTSYVQKIFILITVFFASLNVLYGSRQALGISIACYFLTTFFELNILKNSIIILFISQIHFPVAINLTLINIILFLTKFLKANFKRIKIQVLIAGIIFSLLPLIVISSSRFEFLLDYIPALNEILTPGMYGGSGDSSIARLTLKLFELLTLIIMVIFLTEKKSSFLNYYFVLIAFTVFGLFVSQFFDVGNVIFGRSTTIIKAINTPLIYFVLISNTKKNYQVFTYSIIFFISVYRLFEFINNPLFFY